MIYFYFLFHNVSFHIFYKYHSSLDDDDVDDDVSNIRGMYIDPLVMIFCLPTEGIING